MSHASGTPSVVIRISSRHFVELAVVENIRFSVGILIIFVTLLKIEVLAYCLDNTAVFGYQLCAKSSSIRSPWSTVPCSQLIRSKFDVLPVKCLGTLYNKVQCVGLRIKQECNTRIVIVKTGTVMLMVTHAFSHSNV